jgi:hypothetical protein
MELGFVSIRESASMLNIEKLREETLWKNRKIGLVIGLDEGRKMVNRKTALNMLGLGVPVDTIVQATKLSEEEVLSLARSD